jgi:hypothetical protein
MELFRRGDVVIRTGPVQDCLQGCLLKT